MADAPVFDLNEFVDGQRLRLSSIIFIILGALAMASDGYDLASLGYIAPELLKQWHLAPTALVPAFSAGIIGMMIGGPALGMLGDRYGRKPMVIGGLTVIAILDLIMTGARHTSDLVILRFLIGLMVGGVFPNAASLIAELTPRRIRGRVLIIVSLGVVIGIATPGLVANRLVPTFGWQAILIVGSAAQLLVAAAVALLLPESIKFLVERGDRDAQALRLARRLRPDMAIGEGSRFAAPTAMATKRGSMRPLFAGALILVTPMLWICQAANQMANFFSLTWLPTLLQAGGASTSSAGATASLFSIGGLGAGIVLLLVIDRLGVVPLVGMFLVGVPLVAGMATTDLSPTAHALVIAGAGFLRHRNPVWPYRAARPALSNRHPVGGHRWDSGGRTAWSTGRAARGRPATRAAHPDEQAAVRASSAAACRRRRMYRADPRLPPAVWQFPRRRILYHRRRGAGSARPRRGHGLSASVKPCSISAVGRPHSRAALS